MHEINRHLQILSSGCNRHMHVPVLKFDCNVSQQRRKIKIFMTSYIPYRGQIWQIIHPRFPKLKSSKTLLASDNFLADAHIC